MDLSVIKVCGITAVGDAHFAAEHGATALGFVFFDGSPRCVQMETVTTISASIPKEVLRVGVFANESVDRVRRTVEVARLDVVQLHGDEMPEYCAALGDLHIWKAFQVHESFNPDIVGSYDCEAYLLDGASPAGSFGGSGQTFSWPIARAVKSQGRIIVSGGLDGNNVTSAICEVQPWGVDASSKLESSPGMKDPKKVLSYLEAAKVAAKIQ